MAFIAALAMLTMINSATVPFDVFAAQSRPARSLLADLPAIDTGRLKLQHAERTDRYDIGTFGNSRILMLDADALGFQEGSFFNFGIGGQSFRQSTRMLQSLADSDRTPAVAIVSFDYSELGLPGGSPITPGPIGRLKDRAADIAYLIAHDFPLRISAIFAWNNINEELRQIEAGFTYKVVRARTQLLASGLIEPEGRVDYFRLDGSSIQTLPTAQIDIEWPVRHRRAERYPLLERDLETLASISRSGTRVIIYESPIAPEIRDDVENRLSGNARDVRERLFRACETLGLECYPSPLLDGRALGLYWPDATHAPAPLLGAWLREKLARPPHHPAPTAARREHQR